MDFYVGQVFNGVYPPEAAVWCNENDAYIEKQDGDYIIVQNAAPSSESLFSSLRAERDRRIASSDYLLMPDYPLAEDSRQIVQTYRQELRDLPAQDGAPWDGGGPETPWPTLPKILYK